MRLKNIYTLCKAHFDTVNKITGATYTSNTSYTAVRGWADFIQIYGDLLEINYIQDEVSYLVTCVPEIYRHQSTFNVTNSEWSRILRAKEQLLTCMRDVIDLYESMGLDSDERMGIDIKLPPCKDFGDLKKYIDELDFILYKCPFLKHDKENLKFETVDVGSLWLSFVIVGATVGVTSIILNNLAAFLDKCSIIKSHKLTVEQQKLQLQSMEMDVKAKETLLEGITQIYKAQVEAAIKDLERETGIKLKDGEELGLTLQAADRVNDMLDKGMQLYTTIDSPEEVKALFKPLEMRYIEVSDANKLLEEKESDEE